MSVANIAATTPWVLVHGFTQTHQSWWPTVRALRSRHRSEGPVEGPFQLVDLPGHGSSAPPSVAGLDSVATELLTLAGPGTYVGYSLGGRIVLTAAVLDAAAETTMVQRLVLISATAGIDGDAERVARRTSDDALAERIEAVGTDIFLDEWLRQPLFAAEAFNELQPPDRRFRSANDAAGLAASLRCHGTGQMTPLWDRLEQVSIPTLIVTGERDTKFTELGERLAAALPHCERQVIIGAGHSLPVECPDKLAEILVDWDSRTRQ